MSRSGYGDGGDCENIELYRGNVDRAIGGKRGQRALKDIVTALDTMAVKELAAHSFQTEGGGICTLGALAKHRGVDVSDLEPTNEGDVVDSGACSRRFDIAPCMASEIMFENDERENYYLGNPETDAQRWTRMRGWALKHTKETDDGN